MGLGKQQKLRKNFCVMNRFRIRLFNIFNQIFFFLSQKCVSRTCTNYKFFWKEAKNQCKKFSNKKLSDLDLDLVTAMDILNNQVWFVQNRSDSATLVRALGSRKITRNLGFQNRKTLCYFQIFHPNYLYSFLTGGKLPSAKIPPGSKVRINNIATKLKVRQVLFIYYIMYILATSGLHVKKLSGIQLGRDNNKSQDYGGTGNSCS